MRRAAWIALILPVIAWTSGCAIQAAGGCESNEDCRYGRVCHQGACVFPGTIGPDAGADASSDVGRDQGGGTDPRTDLAEDVPLGEPSLSVNPNPIDFGEVRNGESGTQFVTITNSGTGAATFSERPGFEDAEFFDVGSWSPTRVRPGESLTFSVRVDIPAQQAASTLNDTLRIPYDAEPPGVLTLTALAVVIEDGDPTSCLTWGELPNPINVNVGSTTSFTMRLRNCGQGRLTLADSAFEVQGPIDVTIDEQPFDGTPIPPGGSAIYRLTVLGLEEGEGGLIVRAVTTAGGEANAFVSIRVVDDCNDLAMLGASELEGTSSTSILDVFLGDRVLIEAAGPGFITEATLEEMPEGSLGLLSEQSDSGLGAVLLVPDRPGIYRVNGFVVTDFGCFEPVSLEVAVGLPEAGWLVLAVWPEVNHSGPFADLDMYVSRWNDGYFWNNEDAAGPLNPQANYGALDSEADDAFYTLDRREFGPERLLIPSPAAGERLAIGLHAFREPNGAAGVSPRVLLYVDGELALVTTRTLQNDQFWFVAETLDGTVNASDQVLEGMPDFIEAP